MGEAAITWASVLPRLLVIVPTSKSDSSSGQSGTCANLAAHGFSQSSKITKNCSARGSPAAASISRSSRANPARRSTRSGLSAAGAWR